MELIKHVIDVSKGKHPLNSVRSSHWVATRRKHLQVHPTCSLCGGSDKIEVHHIRPFHLNPELELDPNNLITLCESGKGGVNCHLHLGHLGNFKSYNTTVMEDADKWCLKISNRPKS